MTTVQFILADSAMEALDRSEVMIGEMIGGECVRGLEAEQHCHGSFMVRGICSALTWDENEAVLYGWPTEGDE